MKRIYLAAIICPAAFVPAAAQATSCAPSAVQASQVIASATGSSGGAATATATLAAPGSGKSWQITGIEISGTSATTGTAVAATLSGLAGPAGTAVTATYAVAVGALATPAPPMVINFACPLTAASNTAVVLTVPSFGSGNAASSANVHGFITSP